MIDALTDDEPRAAESEEKNKILVYYPFAIRYEIETFKYMAGLAFTPYHDEQNLKTFSVKKQE